MASNDRQLSLLFEGSGGSARLSGLVDRLEDLNTDLKPRTLKLEALTGLRRMRLSSTAFVLQSLYARKPLCDHSIDLLVKRSLRLPFMLTKVW